MPIAAFKADPLLQHFLYTAIEDHPCDTLKPSLVYLLFIFFGLMR